MYAVDAHVAEVAVARQRDVVLGDLVRLRVVRIEVVLAVEDRAVGHLAVEGERDHQAEVHGLRVDHRQRTGEAEADRARARVRLLAEGELARAEHLRARLQLDVDLEPDDRLAVALRYRVHGAPSNAIARSRAKAASSSLF